MHTCTPTLETLDEGGNVGQSSSVFRTTGLVPWGCLTCRRQHANMLLTLEEQQITLNEHHQLLDKQVVQFMLGLLRALESRRGRGGALPVLLLWTGSLPLAPNRKSSEQEQ